MHRAFLTFGWLLIATLYIATPCRAETKTVAPTKFSKDEKAAADSISASGLRARIKFLSSDLLEGRGPSTRGDSLTQSYIATELEALGVSPGAADGSWVQKVPLIGVKTNAPPTLTFTKLGQSVSLKNFDEFIANSGVQRESAKIDNAELVFVGYGIEAPEYKWDDYKDVDVKGKVLLMMNYNPTNEPTAFAGKKRLYYGRWDYKYEQAAKKGAIGAIIIHTTPSASYPWKVVQTSWSVEKFELEDEDSQRLQMKAWATEAGIRKIANLAGHDLDKLRTSAESREFRPVALGVTMSIALTNNIKKTSSGNVIGVVKGSDKTLAKQAVVYTAHHDHLGMKTDAKEGEDAIYNGALDNASGVASVLEIAKAFTRLPKPVSRSVYFVLVAAEEQGLLGSQYFAKNPPVAADQIAANINTDGIGLWGKTRNLEFVGLGKSSLDQDVMAIAAMQGRIVTPDEFPEAGAFYRSDQFSFAKVGVPATYLASGNDVIGKPKGWGKEQVENFIKTDYHQPGDEYRESWDFSGAIEDAQLQFYLGVKIANALKMPTWNKGDEFEAVRLKVNP